MNFLSAIFSLVMLLGPCLAAEPEVYSVCQVLDHLQDFNCRLVRVRARLESDVDTWLAGENCPNVIQVNRVVFQHLIALRWPSSLLVGCKIGFSEDEGSHRWIRAALARYKMGRDRIDVIVDGVIETRSPLRALATEEPVRRLGFGHLGMAPAQIIVKRIVSLKVSPVKGSE